MSKEVALAVVGGSRLLADLMALCRYENKNLSYSENIKKMLGDKKVF